MAILLLIVFVLYEVPIPQSYGGQATAGPAGGSGYAVSVPSGATVTGGWTALGQASVRLTITSPQGTPVYSVTGYTGSYDFVSVGGGYVFNGTSPSSQVVSIQGSYSATVPQMLGFGGG
jgi:hypothetical protein